MSVRTDLDGADLCREGGTARLAGTLGSTGKLDDDSAATLERRFPSWSMCHTFVLRHSVVLACVATLLVHLLSLTVRLGADEGGFAMVARSWRDGGPYLYGAQWVDRPPGLITLFDVAGHFGAYGVRLTAGLLAVALVAGLA